MNTSEHPKPKVAHLLANWRWTERSEPVADLVAAERKEGAESILICGTPNLSKSPRSVVSESAKKGLQPVTLEMEKHLRFWSALRDVPRLAETFRAHDTEVINCHMPNAHMLGVLAKGIVKGKPILVRTSYSARGPDNKLRSRLLLKSATDGLVVISDRAKREAVENFRIPPSRVNVIEPGIDLERFDKSLTKAQARALFGLGEGDFVVGMASRMQPKRRLELLLDGAAELRERIPNLKLFLVGKGDMNRIVKEPAERMGISDMLVLPGYCEDERLVAAFRAMDVLYFPVGGTDESCRTLREALACGCPVIGGNTGFIPELIKDGKNGLLVDLSVPAAQEAITRLHAEPQRLQAMAERAYADSRQRFSLSYQANSNLMFYQRLKAYRALPQQKPTLSRKAIALLGLSAFMAMNELGVF
ncbi:MAG: glycosyltransferase family 1 protein [Pseudomonadaceae bacterium]|nr:MAG: glycosyltransferase family 1 protein [Pseudomonadaceae bacterium]